MSVEKNALSEKASKAFSETGKNTFIFDSTTIEDRVYELTSMFGISKTVVQPIGYGYLSDEPIDNKIDICTLNGHEVARITSTYYTDGRMQAERSKYLSVSGIDEGTGKKISMGFLVLAECEEIKLYVEDGENYSSSQEVSIDRQQEIADILKISSKGYVLIPVIEIPLISRLD